MTRPAPTTPTALARIVDELCGAVTRGGGGGGPTVADRLLVAPSGMGKSRALRAAAGRLRARGLTVATSLADVAGDNQPAGDVLVLDSLELWSDADLTRLADLAGRAAPPILAATQPRLRRPALRLAIDAFSGQSAPIRMRPLARADIDATLAGMRAVPEYLATELHTHTAGLPFLVAAALGALEHEAPTAAPDAALTAPIADAIRERLYAMTEAQALTVALLTLAVDLGATDIGRVLDLDFDAAADLIEHARCSGLVGATGPVTATVHQQAVSVVGYTRMSQVLQRLPDTVGDAPVIAGPLAGRLAAAGLPASVDQRLDGLRRRVIAGDLTGVTDEIDDIWPRCDAAQTADAVDLCLVIAARRGDAGYAANLARWMRERAPDAAAGARWAVAEAAAGEFTSVREYRNEPTAGQECAPRLGASVDLLVATGLAQSLTEPGPAGLHTLIRAAGVERACVSSRLAPDTAAATAAILALHHGYLGRARAVLQRSPAAELPAPHQIRRRILLAWVSALTGDLTAASAEISALTGLALPTRDEFCTAALQVAIARRTGDAAELRAAWAAAIDPAGEYTLDLFGLLFFGELWVAGAAVGRTEDIGPAIITARRLLDQLGPTSPWAIPLHWAGVHAAIAAGTPAAVVPHAQALAEASRMDRQAAAFATAGRVWVEVLGGSVDVDRVTAAAQALDQQGYTWDAARLAGQSALAAPDSAVSGAMLQLARSLRSYRQPPESATDSDTESSTSAITVLSEREREVAALLLAGLTYKDIGARLFISAKTVEHHVARIRRRLGAESRTELLTTLRAMALNPDSAPGVA
ncbi:MAG: LuxR C-terminal-related transcriptional regulator [Gordonia sp. (in: high G+C Gram-positive bacteria)]